jgi:hypothetical protein
LREKVDSATAEQGEPRILMALTDLPVADLADLYGDQIGKNLFLSGDHSWPSPIFPSRIWPISTAIRSVRICFFVWRSFMASFVCLSIIHAG